MRGTFSLRHMFKKAAQSNGSKTRPRRKQSYHVALELQQLLLDDCRSKDTKPAVRAVCARTWEILEERKRVLRQVPMPKSIDVAKLKEERRAARAARRPATATFTEEAEGISSAPDPSPHPPPGEGEIGGASL